MIDRTTKPAQGADQVFTALNQLAALGTQQMITAIQSSQPVIDAYLAMLRSAASIPMATLPAFGSALSSIGAALPAMPSVSGMLPATTCCEIPETACPPRCVCQIVWHAARGEHAKATITLTNTARKTQNFSIAAAPFHGPDGNTGVSATIAPPSVTLNPDQSATITIGLDVSDKFEGASAYTAEVTVTGQYEQCIELRLLVRPAQAQHCEVRQGDIPTRIRAHRWYDHFQCEEPCFEPATPRRPDNPDGPGHPRGPNQPHD